MYIINYDLSFFCVSERTDLEKQQFWSWYLILLVLKYQEPLSYEEKSKEFKQYETNNSTT